MKKFIVLLLTLVAVIIFYSQFDFKEFMREIGFRKNAEKITLELIVNFWSVVFTQSAW